MKEKKIFFEVELDKSGFGAECDIRFKKLAN